jgi:large subunit ribosomal protein L31
MRQGIHPTYHPEAKVTCSCGNNWTVGSTKPAIHTDVCHACHPFFTGEQRIVDTEGQVDRFYQRLERQAEIRAQAEAQEQAAAAGAVSVDDLDLSSRTLNILRKEGFETAADVLARLEEGEETLLKIQGFGQKSLIEVRKRLRARGYIS